MKIVLSEAEKIQLFIYSTMLLAMLFNIWVELFTTLDLVSNLISLDLGDSNNAIKSMILRISHSLATYFLLSILATVLISFIIGKGYQKGKSIDMDT